MAKFPDKLTDELREALGFMNFQTGPIAHALRSDGEDIPRKAEHEQAHVLHWFVTLALEHGTDWKNKVGERLDAIAAKASQ